MYESKERKANKGSISKTKVKNTSTNPAQLASVLGNQGMLQLIEGKKTQSKVNHTGIPTQMKQNFEERSGFSFDDVRVHYNSDKPAQLQALAYTQGNQVYVAPGQEKHLGHELGHVVQQKQGRVSATTNVNGMAVNDDEKLEREADRLFSKTTSIKQNGPTNSIVQRCYICHNNACLRGEICNNPTLSSQIMNIHQNIIANANLARARRRVENATGIQNIRTYFGNPSPSFSQDHPPLGRYGFNATIAQQVYMNAPTDAAVNGWYHCPYCGYEYPTMQIDHVIPWAKYAGCLIQNNINATPANLANEAAWKIYVACNDPNNLVLACQSCNGSKLNQIITRAWLTNRRALADAQGGF